MPFLKKIHEKQEGKGKRSKKKQKKRSKDKLPRKLSNVLLKCKSSRVENKKSYEASY